MSISNKCAGVAGTPSVRRNSNASEYADFLRLAANFDVTHVKPKMCEHSRAVTQNKYGLRRTDRPVVVTLIGPIIRERISKQLVDANCDVPA